ncbi:putative amino acid binding protein (ABC superfamily, peri_bind) [Moraxellaceae bacterium 17A]|nr:putative amino acid binding protein (ABC superfamily, peri_bind) [Moraxellaceae bacterium 17A]
MAKSPVLPLALLFGSITLFGCTKQESTNGTSTQSSTGSSLTQSASIAKTKLAIGSDMTFPPYEYLNEKGEPSGVDIDIMAKMAADNGTFTPEWIDTRWANLIPGLTGKKFDVLFSSMYITKERLKQIDMIPYYKTDISLLVRSDANLNPQGPLDLCGQKVGTMKGTAFSTQLQEISKTKCVEQNKPAITISEYENSPQTTQALLSKAVDIQYDDAAVMRAATKKLTNRVKITSTQEFYPIVGGIGIRKGDTQTYKLISDGLEKMKASGELTKLLDSYGLKEPTQQDIDQTMN